MGDDMIGRAQGAAAGYLTRLGWADVRVEGNGKSPLVTGYDQGEFVAVVVTVDNLDGPPSVVPGSRVSGYNRVDHISITVVAPNRALLRHRREAQQCDEAPAYDSEETPPSHSR